MKYFLNIIVLMSLFLIASCSPRFAVNTDRDPAVNLRAFQTFMVKDDYEPKGDFNPILNSPLNRDRIAGYINTALENRGYEMNQNQPDLIVRFYTSVKEKQEVYNQGFNNFWFNPFFPNNNTYTRNYEEGTLIVDILDAQTEELIWQGWAVGEIDYSSDRYKERLKAKVMQIFENFPSRNLASNNLSQNAQ